MRAKAAVMASMVSASSITQNVWPKPSGDDVVEGLIVGEGKEYRLDVGILHTHVLHAVFLLVAAGEFMLLDIALHVVGHARSHDDAILGAAVHGLGVDVVVVGIVLYEPSVGLEGLEIFHSLVIYFGVVLVGAGLEIDFRLYNVVQRFFISLGLAACFFAIEDIVGAGCHFGDKVARGTNPFERFYCCHFSEFWVLVFR